MAISNSYPAEVKLFARGAFIQGHSYNETAKLIKKQYPKARCNAETIRRWANQKDDEGQDWNSLKYAVSTELKERQKDGAVELLEKHSELYQLMIEKGMKGLKDKESLPRSAAEAGGLLDTGIRGQRASLKELIALNFVKAVFTIVSEEVVDETTRKRIAFRFRELSQNFQ